MLDIQTVAQLYFITESPNISHRYSYVFAGTALEIIEAVMASLPPASTH